MKFESTLTTTIDEVLTSTNNNQSQAAKVIGISRSTLSKYMKEPENVLLVQINGKLTPFVSDRRNGHHKKESK